MTPIQKALEQMERGMGNHATAESRRQVNRETLACRAERAESLANRRASNSAGNPQQPKDHYQRLQNGELGRLD